jgi:hypothetical protein
MMVRKFAGIPVQINLIEENVRRVQRAGSSTRNRKAFWNMELNSFVSYDKFGFLQRDFALRSDKGALRSPP